MMTRFLLLLSGLMAGLWLRPLDLAASPDVMLLLAVGALLAALVTTPRGDADDRHVRAEEAYRGWLDAWRHMHTASDADRADAVAALAAAGDRVLLLASDRVVRALRAASDARFATPVVAQLVLDMRRGLRRAGMSVRSADLEALLASPTDSGRALEDRLRVHRDSTHALEA